MLYCPGFSGTVFCGSWLIGIPSPLFSKCMVCVISMHQLTAWRLYHSLNASQEHLLLLPPGSFGSLCFVRVPASLGPFPPLVFVLLFCPGSSGTAFCSVRVPDSLGPATSCVLLLFCPGFSGRAFVLLGSLLLWVPPHTVCDFSFLSRLLSDSFGFLMVTASLGPSAFLRFVLLYCPGFSGTVFCGSWIIWIPSPFFLRCMVWVISMHHLTAWHLYNSLNASQ